MESGKKYSSGFVSIVGRPNVGKSTLMNALIGEKLSIISDKPQTTRNKISGIISSPDSQIIFIDTPGIHEATSLFNKKIVDEAIAALDHVDLILFMAEPRSSICREDAYILEKLNGSSIKKILVINKIDKVDREKLLPAIAAYNDKCSFSSVFLVSALKRDGLESLLAEIKKNMPPGVKYFDDDYITDKPERFLTAEIIREKVFNLTLHEVPYSTAVIVEQFKEMHEKNLIVIDAAIIVEKDSQKGIIIGKQGKLLKRIGSEARADIENLLNVRIFLNLFVKVSKNWTKDGKKLKEYGY